MTRIPPLTSTADRPPRRPRLAFAVTALAALALAACGTEKTRANGSQNKPADSVGAQPAAVPPSPDKETAFLEMLVSVAQPRVPDQPLEEEPPASSDPTSPGPSAPPMARPTGPLPIDKTPPGPTAPVPDTTEGPIAEVPLNALEKCEGRRHVERITQVLSGMADATPAQVRKVLNDLGYINERIHGLKRSGAATRFFVDLRFMGGSLCLNGSVTGSKTVIEAFGHPETGPFAPVKRKQ
ncbi:hypothetical protein ACFVWX_19455 [Streptomyces sp. NPDC058220]|uniref:hypothetical protein n=1 Tax=unclassified Streptomyces TaxID=2593676 RepID=UPI0036471556